MCCSLGRSRQGVSRRHWQVSGPGAGEERRKRPDRGGDSVSLGPGVCAVCHGRVAEQNAGA